MFTDYRSGLLQLSASIRTYFDLPTHYDTDPDIDKWLQKHHYKHIFLILIDGMGSEILRKYAQPDSFFRTHMLKDVMTVYPPTTVAATTAIRTGLAPSETGWLGWNQHFNDINDEVLMFFGKSQYDETTYGQSYAYRELPVKFIYDELNEHGKKAASIWPAWGDSHPSEDYSDILNTLLQLQEDPDLQYVYAYWDLFDTLMHEVGPSNAEVAKELCRLDDLTKQFMKFLSPDTGVIIIADHGQIDVENIDISKDEQLCSYLKTRPSLESRTTSFFIHDDKINEFEQYFNQTYGGDFLLLTHKQVIEQKIFGPYIGLRFEEFIGDYVAFATGSKCLCFGVGLDNKGQHAGTTKDEMMIPIILNTMK